MSLPADYIDVVRTFQSESDSQVLAPRYRMGDLTNWDKMLGEKAHIVLIGASGMGKTREMEAQARRLRDEGRHAFYATARDIALHGLGSPSQDLDESQAFTDWMKNDEQAVVFVDALDELSIARTSASSVANRLRSQLRSQNNWQLVLSTRTGGWPNSVAREFQKLVCPEYPKLSVYSLMPLDTASIQAFADVWIGADVDSFMEALAREELERMIEIRPFDLKGIIQSWKDRDKQLGTWRQVLQDIIESALAPVNPERDADRKLTLELGRTAASRLGAASLLVKADNILLPGEPSQNPISAISLFSDWQAILLRELFETHLFVHKGEGTVQLLQGDVPSFLAARWLADRVNAGKSVTWLRNQVLVQLYGGNVNSIPAHLEATAGWLASECDVFRHSIQCEFPRIVLFGGDPDVLSSEEILVALDALLEQFRNRPITAWPTPRTFVKLARPELETEIVSRLMEEEHQGAKQHILEWCYAGSYASAVTAALTIAHDLDSDLAAMAVSVVGKCGQEADKRRLLTLVTRVSESTLGKQLLTILVPLLKGQELVDLLARVSDKRVYRVAKYLSAISEADLSSLFSQLRTTDRKTGDLVLVVAIELAQREVDSKELVDAFIDVEVVSIMTARHLRDEDIEKFSNILQSKMSLRRSLWEERLARVAIDQSHPLDGRFGVREVSDISWLFTRLEGAVEPHDWYLKLAIQSIYDAQTSDRRTLFRGGDISPGLLKLLLKFDASTKEREEHQRERDEHRSAEKTKKREADRKAILKRMPHILRGGDVAILNWVMDHAHSGHNRSLSREKVVALVGDLADGIVQGFKAFWRGNEVTVPDPLKNTTYASTLIGLSGIGFDVSDGLDVASLSSTEAKLAARHALHELNGFPGWFAELLCAHPQDVREVLIEAIRLEWQADVQHVRTIGRGAYGDESIGQVIRALIVSRIIEEVPPGSASVLSSSVDVCLLIDDGNEDLAKAAEKNSKRQLHQSQWLRLWIHLRPCAAASWFEKHLKESTEELEPLFLEVAGLIGRDLDEGRRNIKWSGLEVPEALERWATLLLRVFPFDVDLKHEGAYSPGHRDYAQQFRDKCLRMLTQNSSVEARNGLLRLQGIGLYGKYLLEQQQAYAATSMATIWTEDDILAVENGDEKEPRTLDELFHMVCGHLDRIANELEIDESSYRELFRPDTKECDIQRWVTAQLQKEASSFYSVGREVEVGNNKEVDITAFAKVGRIPIEIKPTASYSLKALEKCIRDQLMRQYMVQQERSHGIFLFVHHKPKPRGWRIGGPKKYSMITVKPLMDHLRAYARSVAEPLGKQIAVQLINIEDTRKTVTS